MRGVFAADAGLLTWAVLLALGGVGAWGVWRSTAGRDRSRGSGRDGSLDVARDGSSFPAYDVPLSWDEARAVQALLGVLTTQLLAPASAPTAVYYRGVLVDVSKVRADALLYAELLRARIGSPQGGDDV